MRRILGAAFTAANVIMRKEFLLVLESCSNSTLFGSSRSASTITKEGRQKPFVIWGEPATFPARERPMAPRRSDHLAPQSGTESANEVGQILTKEQFAERGIPLLRDKTTCQEQLTPRPAGSDANAF